MFRAMIVVCVTGSVLVIQSFASGQTRTGELELLKREVELLKRELDLLKRENELLKKENAALKKGTKAVAAEPQATGDLKVTVDNVDYVYQGTTRNGGKVIVTILATSQDGNRKPPTGIMLIVDDNGNKYAGRALHAAVLGNAAPSLREGIPVKLFWEFGGPVRIIGQPATTAPSAKLARYAGVFIHRAFAGNDTIDFRNVPAVVVKSKAK